MSTRRIGHQALADLATNDGNARSEGADLISIVIPCFNEEGNVAEVYSRVTSVLQSLEVGYELIFVDDGSTDRTCEMLTSLCASDDRAVLIELSRNFGHQQAIYAGLEHARGDALIMMDADLQHPPALIPKLLEKWREGYDIVYTVRKDPPGTALFKKATAKFFYRLVNFFAALHIPENSADFRLLDKEVVKHLRSLREKAKFLRGLVEWMGFEKYAIYYEASPRYAGRTKYSVIKMVKFAFDGITSFSTLPLHIATILGVLVSILSFLYAAYAIYMRLFTREAVPGWTSVLVALLFLGGIQLLCLGVIGEYLGRVYEEAKNRPPYIIRNMVQRTQRNQ